MDDSFGALAGSTVKKAAKKTVEGVSQVNDMVGAVPRFVGGQAVDYVKTLFGMPTASAAPLTATAPSPASGAQTYTPVSSPSTVPPVAAAPLPIPAASAPTPAVQPVVNGAWAAPHGAAPGVGAQLVAGPATTSVSSSRDANGNLVFTNAPPDPNAQPAVAQAPVAQSRGLGAAMGAILNQRRGAAQEAQATTIALKGPEMAKNAAELAKLQAQLQLAGATNDPAMRAAILGGYAPATEHVAVPQGYMGDFKSDVPVVTTSGPGAGTIKMVQPQSAPAQLKEGQTGMAKNANGENVRVIIRNGVPVPI